MIIGIDLDDTLTDFAEFKYNFVKDYLQKNNLNFAELDPTAPYIESMFDFPKDDFMPYWFDFYEEMFLGAPIRENALEMLTKIKELGHTIIIVTARTKKWFEDPFHISKIWLDKHNIPYDHLITEREDKDVVCKENNITFFIDDYPRNIDALTQADITTCIMETPYNKSYENKKAIRVLNWQQIYEIIKPLS